jgi:hypothetical protein
VKPHEELRNWDSRLAVCTVFLLITETFETYRACRTWFPSDDGLLGPEASHENVGPAIGLILRKRLLVSMVHSVSRKIEFIFGDRKRRQYFTAFPI